MRKLLDTVVIFAVLELGVRICVYMFLYGGGRGVMGKVV